MPVFARLWPVRVRVRVSFMTGAVRSAILATAGLLVPFRVWTNRHTQTPLITLLSPAWFHGSKGSKTYHTFFITTQAVLVNHYDHGDTGYVSTFSADLL